MNEPYQLIIIKINRDIENNNDNFYHVNLMQINQNYVN